MPLRVQRPYRFHVDSCLGGRDLCDRVELIGGEAIRRHVDFVSDGTLDVDWLGSCAAAGWVILTSDGRIRGRSAERAEVARNGGVLVVFPDRLTQNETVEGVAAALPGIRGHLEASSPPFIIRIGRSDWKGKRERI